MEATDGRPNPVSLCARCVREAPEWATWCPHCGAPRSILALAGTFESVITTWVGIGTGLAARHPRGIVVLGLWLLLLPTVTFSILSLLLRDAPDTSTDFARFAFTLVVGGVLLALLLRSTLRYARPRASTRSKEGPEDSSSAGGSPSSDQPLAR